MKIRLLFCIALLLLIIAWFPAASRLLPPNHDAFQQPGTRVRTNSVEASNRSKQVSEAGRYRGTIHLGSSPPKCEHRCDGCRPCIAIQSPTNTDQLSIQFTNYEPISWKCKCEPAVYSP